MKLPVFAALALVALVTGASASLMAVDLGGEFLKVAVVKAGRTPISIAINEMSRRKTPALVGFLDGERVLGEAAVTMSGRHPDKVFGYLRDLLGKPAKHPSVKQFVEENSIIFDIVEDPVRKSVRVKTPDTGTEYSVEELVASVLTYAHQISASHSGVDIRDTVILVPAYFGHAQRQAMLDAAELAGLNVLSLMHSHAAAALQYGIERSFTNRTENVVIYDVGASGVTAALVQFSEYPVKEGSKTVQQSQFEVRDVAWSEGVGAQHLDLLLLRHFAAEFVAKHGTKDVLSVPKAVAKMAKPVRRSKEMLSANVRAPFSVDELYDNKDFSSSISRADFEALAGDFWSTMKAPLQELVARNNLTADSFTVQLVGGGSRVPRVQAELASVVEGVKLEKQLDADEAAVLGGGLYAANKSTMFRLRKFGMKDGHVFPVSVTIDDIEAGGVPAHHHKFSAANGGEALIPYMKVLDTKRRVSLTETTADPLKVTLSYAGDRLPSSATSPKLVSYSITGLTGVLERYNQTGKVQLHFVGDSNGLVYLQKADATVEFIENVEVEKEVPDDEGADASKDASKGDEPKEEEANPEADEAEDEADGKDDASAEAEDDKPEAKSSGKDKKAGKDGAKNDDAKSGAKDGDKKADKDGDKKDDAKSGKKDDKKDEKPKPKMKKIKVMKRVKRTRVVALELAEPVRHGVLPMSSKEKAESKLRLKELRTKELAKQESARAKNELESYIIAMHGKLADNEDIIKVTTEEQRDEFSKLLTAMEDWLYMDEAADEALAKVYIDKLAELLVLGGPIEGRVYELARRDERIKGAQKLVEIIGMSTNSWPETRPWLNATHVGVLQAQADELSAWLAKGIEAQSKKELHEEPALKVDDIAARVETLHNMFKRLQNVKAPKPPPPPPAPPAPPADGTNDDAADSSKPSSESKGEEKGEADAKPAADDPKDELRR